MPLRAAPLASALFIAVLSSVSCEAHAQVVHPWQRLGADITPAWLDKVRTASVRLSNCTATFVSPDGLILTNHHCVAACLAQLSNATTDRLRDGFIAATRNDELRCQTQRADVLVKIEDITAKVNAATAGSAQLLDRSF